MKGYILKFTLIIIAITQVSCEEVVNIDLNESEAKLVVEASILKFKGYNSNIQTIKLTETTSFYDTIVPEVNDAQVKITMLNGEVFNFNSIGEGKYVNSNFNADIFQPYELEIIHNNQTYIANEVFTPVVALEDVEQEDGGGFTGEDIEIKAYYTDPVDIDNFYLFRFILDDVSLQIYDDQFTDGNRTFGFYRSDDLSPGDILTIQMQGISERYYNYLFILRSQSGSNQGGPFQTQPATVRGNIINTTNPDNFAFGYFRLSEVDMLEYTVQ